MEVVVVDDGSRDDTTAAVSMIEGVHVVRHEHARGVAAARNTGIGVASGTWVALLDDDDLWAPDKLARQLASVADRGTDWAYASALVVDERGRLLWPETAPPAEGLVDLLHRENPIPAGASNVLVRRELVQRLGGFDTDLQHFADWDLWLGLALAGPPAVLDEPLVAYVHHADNMHGDAAHSGRAELDLLEQRIRTRSGRTLDRARMNVWMAYGEGVAGRYWSAARIAGVSALRHRSAADARQAAGMVVRAFGLHRDRGRRGAPAPEWARAVTEPD